MGSGAKVGAGMYPAKFSFGTATADCSDFVVFNTGLAGTSTQASIIAYTNIYRTTCLAPIHPPSLGSSTPVARSLLRPP